jgi:hypothetical protein
LAPKSDGSQRSQNLNFSFITFRGDFYLNISGLVSFLLLNQFFAWGSNSPAATPEQRLKQIVGNQAYADLIAYRQNFKTVRKQTDWVKLFKQARGLQDNLSPPLSALHEKFWNMPKAKPLDFGWVEPLTPGLKVSLQAEGTSLVMVLHYPTFAKLAALTPENADDNLISLLIKAEGERSNAWPRWFNQTWDYGGCTKLGSGLHLSVWQDIQKQSKQAPFLAFELNRIRAALVKDLKDNRLFCLPQAAVLREYDQLLKAPGWSAQEKKDLTQHLNLIKKDPQFEYDCASEKVNCSYG